MTDQAPPQHDRQAADVANGRLAARLQPPTVNGLPSPHALGLGAARDGWLYVPGGYRSNRPAPLLVFLHGAGGTAQRGKRVFQFIANRTGILLLVPESRGRTWDLMRGGFGPDVRFLDQALAHTCTSYAVDAARLALGGFSDGASYALSLGLTNGDLFTHIIALSPGFAAPARPHGRPRLFITHGTRDRVLPIERCSRRIVPHMRAVGYEVQYGEFTGGHVILPWIVRDAIRWFLSAP